MQLKKMIPAALALALATSTVAGAANTTAQKAGSVQIQTSVSSQSQLQKLCQKYGFSFCGQQNCPTATKPQTKPGTTTTPITKPGNTTVTKPGNTTVTKPDTTPDTSTAQGDFASQVVQLVNAERAKAGLSALKVDSKVQKAAQVRAAEQAKSFSHTRPNGASCFTALTEAGVSYRGAGENIAYGQKSPQAVMNAWMNSSSHRQNIMNAKFTTIGVGYTVINGTAYWAQMFTY